MRARDGTLQTWKNDPAPGADKSAALCLAVVGPPAAMHGHHPQSAVNPALQPDNEDVALETLIEPELLIAAGQPRQVFRHIGGQFGH